MEEHNHEYEYQGSLVNGFLMLFFTFILLPVVAAWTGWAYMNDNVAQWLMVTVEIIAALLFVLGCVGYFTQQPNEARVMIFFGKYRGTCRKVGFYWVNPFMDKKKLSLRIRNMDIDPIKVNDKTGNPVLIGMVLVWRVRDTYKVTFDLDAQSSTMQGGAVNPMALDSFVRVQSDAALREVTGHFAYDNTDTNDPNELTLRGSGKEINEMLEAKINERLAMAGLEVIEARLNYLAYAPEIAAVMLRRQQADAIISAREKIVEGAVSMVDMALRTLQERDVAKFTDDQKAAMVGNLLTVLCADEPLTPTLNATV
mgnify:FL=1